MKKRTLTPEQIAARDARRSKFRALARTVADMTEQQRAELIARCPALVTIEGRALSPFNTCLAVFQNPRATIVGGFRQWIAHGRAVRKGEHGIAIWVPCGSKADAGAGEAAPTVADASGEQGGSCRFITGTVFDVTQTDEIARGGDAARIIDLDAVAPEPEAPAAPAEMLALT